MERSSPVYQSGEPVPALGIYEIVDSNRTRAAAARLVLQPGDVFPVYEGWEVCWRCVRSDREECMQEDAVPRERFS